MSRKLEGDSDGPVLGARVRVTVVTRSVELLGLRLGDDAIARRALRLLALVAGLDGDVFAVAYVVRGCCSCGNRVSTLRTRLRKNRAF